MQRRFLLLVLSCLVAQVYAQEPTFCPGSFEIFEGGCVTLEAKAYGSAQISYQWLKDGEMIQGADSPAYTIQKAKLSDSGTYTLYATNHLGSATTDMELTVYEDNRAVVAIDWPVAGTTFTPGGYIEFEGHSFEREAWSSPLQIWALEYHNGDQITPGPEVAYEQELELGHVVGHFIVPDDEPAPNSFYRLKVKGVGPRCLEGADSIDIPWSGDRYTDAPIISKDPQSIEVAQGSRADFSVTAHSATAYQWRLNDKDIPGATASTYSIQKVTSSSQGEYSVLISNPNGTILSDPATLTVVAKTESIITVKTNPSNLSITVDGEQVASGHAFTSSIGNSHSIAPVSPQTVEGTSYAFSNWAHGGALTQNVTTSLADTSYTVNYSSHLAGPWRTTDVGAVAVPGEAAYNYGVFTVRGSGNDIWAKADAFRIVYQSLEGDVDIRARVVSLTNTNPWAKAGVMIRNSTDRSSKHAMTVITPGNGVSFQYRKDAAGASVASGVAGSAPHWVRVVRQGNTFTSYTSTDGTNWSVVGNPVTIQMNSRVIVGLVITSHNPGTLGTVAMTDVSVSAPVVAASVGEALIFEDEDTFDVYPNPVGSEQLNVRFFNNSDIERSVEIVSLTGNVVYQNIIPEGSASIQVDIRNLSAGAYVVRVSENDKVRTRTFVKN